MSSPSDGEWPPFPNPQKRRISVGEALAGLELSEEERWEGDIRRYAIGDEWKRLPVGGQSDRYFQLVKVDPRKPSGAICKSSGEYPSAASVTHWLEPRKFARKELCRIATFPDDFRFVGDYAQVYSRIGNCVPPKFTQAIATCIREHILGDRDFTYLSTFAGCGGSSLGYKWAGGHGVAAVEFDANACETYRLNFPDTPVLERDICTVTAEELLALTGLQVGELDVLDGSPPCQGFSTAGKAVLTDPRNSLFREYVRLIEGIQPKVFVMENVSGMVKGKMRIVFRDIMLALKATGYTVRCKLLNAMYYEVPQSRERLIWIGVRGDLGKTPGFPGPVGKPKTAGEAIGEVGAVLSDGYEGNAFPTDKPGPTLPKGRPLDILTRSQRISPWMDGPAACICKTSAGYEVQEAGKKRRLTIAEAKALCSFPADWALTGNYTEQWARLGNAVMPRFMYHIAKYIRETILQPQEAG